MSEVRAQNDGEWEIMDERQLDERLARFRGADLTAPDHELDRLLSDVSQAAGAPDWPRRPSRRLVAGGIAVAVIASGIALPAAADGVRQFLTQVDGFGPGSEVIEGSEWIDTGAPDFAEYARATIPDDLPLAPDTERDQLLRSVIALHEQEPAITQEVSLRRTYEVVVHCAWAAEWRRALDEGDGAARNRAVDVLRSAADWPAIVATDGGGISDLYREYANLAEVGDTRAMAPHIIQADCNSLAEVVGQ